MTRPFRFAVQGGPFDDPVAIAAHARLVESLGYEELYSFDHIGAVDPFAPLIVAADATEKLRVGPLVLNNEFHQPALLARTAATVDRMTGGRLVVGIGTGYDQSEHDSIGSPILPPGPRVDRFGESLTVLRALLDEGSCRFDGDHHTVALDDLGVRPTQEHVPLLIRRTWAASRRSRSASCGRLPVHRSRARRRRHSERWWVSAGARRATSRLVERAGWRARRGHRALGARAVCRCW